MLRRTLLIRIGLLVACFVAGAVVAIGLLQDTIPRIASINADAAQLTDAAIAVRESVAELVQANPPSAAAPTARERLDRTMDTLARRPGLLRPGSVAAAAFDRLVAELAGADGPPAGSGGAAPLAPGASAAAKDLADAVRAYVASEQAAFARALRNLVFALTLAALVMVNIAVVVLLRTAQVVLRPVSELVEGSRELAAEHFEHRVRVDRKDEFGELALAHNRLAEQLAAAEERKTEALRQLAVALNHDLNNAMATMEMQLALLDRESGRAANLAWHVRNIQAGLRRMSVRVASLKNIRRVVLTEYADGQKMVDLERSMGGAATAGPAAPVELA